MKVTVAKLRSLGRLKPDLLLLAKLAVLVSLLAALYFDVLLDLAFEWWRDPGASYGILIPPLALYIVYLRWPATRAIPSRAERRGLWLIVLSCATLLAGRLSAGFFLSRISFVMLLGGLLWTFWGYARFRTLAFSLLLLGTMVPPPALIYPSAAVPLQLFASRIATDLAQLLGTSVYRDGNIIHLANLSLGVVEACSGLQALSALIVASLLLGFIEDVRLTGRLLLLALSVPLAILMNVFRVAGTAVLADYELEFAMGFYHLFSGWLVFVLGFGLLWLVGKLLPGKARANA
jgi:exosortase